MSTNNGKPTLFAEHYDALVFVALERGVCPKILNGGGGDMHSCGRELVPGTHWCVRHQR